MTFRNRKTTANSLASADGRGGRGEPRRRVLRTFMRDKMSVAGLVIALLIAMCSVLAPVLAPYDPRTQSIAQRLQPPSHEHLLGTDKFGRDILTRILYGARVSMLVGLLSVGLGGAVGTMIGIFSGYRGGAADRAIMGAVDVMLSFPDLLLGILVLIVLGPGLASVVVAIAFSMLPRFVRVARSPTLALRETPFVEACRALGAPELRVLLRHVLPNILGQVLVVATLWIASAIRVEASLSFLGLGVQPPAPTWGNMIREGIKDIFTAPWIALAPGVAIMLTVLAFNMLGDGLRDVFDPRATQ